MLDASTCDMFQSGAKRRVFIFNLNSKADLDKPLVAVNRCLHCTCASHSYFRSFSLGLEKPCSRTRRFAFCVPKSDIAEQGYDLSINRYKEVVHEEVNHRAPQAILDELESIEKEITQGMKQLRGMLK